MRYLFILGRNIELSAVEIFSYFEKEKVNVKNYNLNSNGLLVETEKEIDAKKMIKHLGGTIAIGKAVYSGKINEVLKKVESEEIYFGNEIKFTYSVFNFGDEEDYHVVLDAIKNNFRNEKLKARFKSLRGEVKMQDSEIYSGSPSKLMENDIIYFLFQDKEAIFGKIEEITDIKENEMKDIGKPARRASLAISPRLAKILINLSQVTENELLLDPFCGIGVVLQEALIQNINVIGVDIDKNAVDNAKRNLNWLKSHYKISSDAKIINEDSRTIALPEINGIATEPSLGVLLTKVPSKNYAESIIKKFDYLMIDILNNLKKYLEINRKIAFTSPFISTGRERIGCNINRICEKTGLEVCSIENIEFPIAEFREKQIVGREIYVLKKT